MRESVSRLFASRVSWIWVFAEPVVHIGFVMYIFTAIRVRKVGEVDTAIWLMIGLVSYFMFRKTGDKVTDAVNQNQGLFAYRQVKPVDTLIARAILEGTLLLVVTVCLIGLATLANRDFAPEDPLAILAALLALWILGFGYGLVLSALYAVASEARIFVKVIMRPMYLISGVIFPLASLPAPIREILMWNPVANGLEMARLGITHGYHAVPEMDPSYLFKFALVSMLLGLTLQKVLADRIVAQ